LPSRNNGRKTPTNMGARKKWKGVKERTQLDLSKAGGKGKVPSSIYGGKTSRKRKLRVEKDTE